MTARVIGPGAPADGDKNFVYEQLVALATWIVNHPLNKRPAVAVVSLADKHVNAAVTYLSDNALQIDFAVPFSGRAYLN